MIFLGIFRWKSVTKRVKYMFLDKITFDILFNLDLMCPTFRLFEFYMMEALLHPILSQCTQFFFFYSFLSQFIPFYFYPIKNYHYYH